RVVGVGARRPRVDVRRPVEPRRDDLGKLQALCELLEVLREGAVRLELILDARGNAAELLTLRLRERSLRQRVERRDERRYVCGELGERSGRIRTAGGIGEERGQVREQRIDVGLERRRGRTQEGSVSDRA